MTDNKISLKTLGLFAEMYFTTTDDGGYDIYPYRSYRSSSRSSSNTSTTSNSFSSKTDANSTPYSSYKWDEDTAARIFRDSFADLKELNSYDLSVVKLKKNKLPCQLVDEYEVLENNPYNTPSTVVSLFKETDHPPRIFCKHRESKTISVDLNGKNYDLQEINSFMDSDISMKEFLNILTMSYKHKFKRTNNSYLDCMFLMHKITKLRIALPMKSDNDITTCAFGMVCAIADLSIKNSSSLQYSNSDSDDKMYSLVVPSFTLEFGTTISTVLRRKSAKPSLNSFYDLLLFDLSCPFRTSGGNQLTTRKEICTIKDLIDSSGHLIREISWEIMLNTAKKWNQRISVFECLYCYDLDDPRWFKFDDKTKRQTVINRAVDKHVVHPFCLDDLKIRSKILGCGPYIIKDEDKSTNDPYISMMEKLLQLQGLDVKKFDLKSINNESQHSKLIKNVLKSEKKTNTLIFDLSKKRLDQLESKSIQNNSLLRFRTLFYPDKMSLDILKDLLFDKQKKNYAANTKGCLRFDWDCERCLMSLLQSTLDIYFICLKIFCNIIENKVQENFFTNNETVAATSMRNVFEDDVEDDENHNIINDDDNKPKVSQNKNKEARATFVLMSALEYFLPSTILDFCFCSEFSIVVPETNKKSNDLCEIHKNESNNYIVRCFENTARFYEDEKKNEEIETKLFEIFLANTSSDETTTVKTNLVELLQQIVKVGQQYEPPAKEKQKKKIKKSLDENDQENNTAKEEVDVGTNKESPTGKMDDADSFKSDLEGSESESGSRSKSPLTCQELFPSGEEEEDRQSANHLSNSEIEKSSNVAFDIQDIIKFSRGYYPDDVSFALKMKEVFDILSMQSSANIYIIMRSKKSNRHIGEKIRNRSSEQECNDDETTEQNKQDGDHAPKQDYHKEIYQSPNTNLGRQKSTSGSKRPQKSTSGSKRPGKILQGSAGKKKFAFK